MRESETTIMYLVLKVEEIVGIKQQYLNEGGSVASRTSRSSLRGHGAAAAAAAASLSSSLLHDRQGLVKGYRESQTILLDIINRHEAR